MFFRQPMMVVVRAELYCVHNTVLNTFKGTTVLPNLTWIFMDIDANHIDI